MTDWTEEDPFVSAVPGCVIPGRVAPGYSYPVCFGIDYAVESDTTVAWTVESSEATGWTKDD